MSRESPPLISCIVPVYNGERSLRACLESIIAQTWRPIEVIVVDDGSTDRSAKIAESFGPPVSCLRQKNAGPVVARNRGITAARGAFISFLDADDLWSAEKLERQMARFAARPELGISVALFRNFWDDEARDEAEPSDDPGTDEPRPGASGTMLVRAEVFVRVGLFDQKLSHHDTGEWRARAQRSGIVTEVLEEVLLFRRLHETNRSRDSDLSRRKELLAIAKAAFDQRQGNGG